MRTELQANGQPALEIRIILNGGDHCRFAIDDLDAARHILAETHPTKIFATPHLLLGGDTSINVFPAAQIERIEFIADNLPVWPFLGGAKLVREITEAEFTALFDPAIYAIGRRRAAQTPGIAQLGYTEYWTASGAHLFWEVHMASLALTPMDFRPYVQNLLNAGGLHFQTIDKGVAIFNLANLTRMTFHPGPPTLPPGAWPARRL